MEKKRQSIRLRGFDYSREGVYFISLCAHNRECFFGEVNGENILLNDFGLIVQEEWLQSAIIRKEIELDTFVVMPNHFHGIVCITNAAVGATGRSPLPSQAPTSSQVPVIAGPAPKSLGALIAGFKSSVTKRINMLRDTPGMPVWQRNYYERIVRDDKELNAIRQYIRDNPMKWHLDKDNPVNQ